MTPLAMAHEAAKAMAAPVTVGVIFTVPKGSMPKGFPRGELLNEMKRDGIVQRTYRFEPAKVIAWLIKNELVTMERTSDNVLTFSEPIAARQGGEGIAA